MIFSPPSSLRALWALLALGASLILLTSSVQAAPPANDNFAERADLGISTTFEASALIQEATLEPGELRMDPFPSLAAHPVPRSVWYKWTAPASGRILVRTNAAYVGAFTGTDRNALELVCRSVGSYPYAAVSFHAAEGTVYSFCLQDPLPRPELQSMPKRVTILGSPMETMPGLPVITISPAVVDVTDADATVRITATGRRDSVVPTYFILSQGVGPDAEVAVDWERTGQVSRDILIPRGTPPGRWNVGVGAQEQDEDGLFWVFGAAPFGSISHTMPQGLPSGIEILNSGRVDSEAPQASDLAIVPAVVDVSSGDAAAHLRFRLRDPGSGVLVRDQRAGSRVKVWTKSGIELTDWQGAVPALVSGDLQDGLWEVPLTIPEVTEPGPLALEITLSLQDRAGNWRPLSTRPADFIWMVVAEPMPQEMLPALTVIAPRPANDPATNASVMPSTLPSVGTGLLARATRDRPAALPPESDGDDPEVWHRWVAPADGWVRVEAGAEGTGMLNAEIYDGPPSSAARLPGKRRWMATAGREYWIAVIAHAPPFDSVAQSSYRVTLSMIEPNPVSLEVLDISPRVLDLTDADGSVSVTGNARLQPGWRCVRIGLSRSESSYFSDPETVEVTPVVGADGLISYSGSLPFSRWEPGGQMSLSLLFSLQRDDGSPGTWEYTFTSGYGYPFPAGVDLAFEIVNRAPRDAIGPQILRFEQVSPPPNVRSGPGEAVFELDIWDDRSGFDPASTAASGLGAVALAHIAGALTQPTATFSLIHGDTRSGTWRLRIPLPRGLPSGRWSMRLQLLDGAGHLSGYSSSASPFSEIGQGLQVQGVDGYDAWRWNARLSRGEGSAVPYGPVTGDDDGNGVPNLLAYAFDLNHWNVENRSYLPPPGDPSAPVAFPLYGLPDVSLQPGPQLALKVRFLRVKEGPAAWRTGLTYRPQFADNPAGPWTDALPDGLRIEVAGDYSEVVSASDPAPGGKTRFARVLVEYREPE